MERTILPVPFFPLNFNPHFFDLRAFVILVQPQRFALTKLAHAFSTSYIFYIS